MNRTNTFEIKLLTITESPQTKVFELFYLSNMINSAIFRSSEMLLLKLSLVHFGITFFLLKAFSFWVF